MNGLAAATGRARVLARREQVCIVDLVQRSVGPVSGFEKNGSRGPVPPSWVRQLQRQSN